MECGEGEKEKRLSEKKKGSRGFSDGKQKKEKTFSPPFFFDASAASSAARCAGVRKPVAVASAVAEPGAAGAGAEVVFVDPPPPAPVILGDVLICFFLLIWGVSSKSGKLSFYILRLQGSRFERDLHDGLERRGQQKSGRERKEREAVELGERLHRQRGCHQRVFFIGVLLFISFAASEKHVAGIDSPFPCPQAQRTHAQNGPPCQRRGKRGERREETLWRDAAPEEEEGKKLTSSSPKCLPAPSVRFSFWRLPAPQGSPLPAPAHPRARARRQMRTFRAGAEKKK